VPRIGPFAELSQLVHLREASIRILPATGDNTAARDGFPVSTTWAGVTGPARSEVDAVDDHAVDPEIDPQVPPCLR
jgi:hypothetical protein